MNNVDEGLLNTPQIVIVGLGISGINQITKEGLAAIKSSKKIFYLGPNAKKDIQNLKTLDITVESIMHLYNNGEIDKVIYKRIFDYLIDAAQQFNSVCLLVPGHPRLGVSVVAMLEKNEANVKVKTIPGISCFDTLINDLKRDPIEFGSLLIDANRLLLYDIPISTSLDIYIFHVCSIGTTKVHLTDSSKENKVMMLKEHLKKFYSENKKIYLISSSMNEESSFLCNEYSIGKMESLLNDVHFGTTLYIPGERPIEYNKTFLKLLSNTNNKSVVESH